MPSLELLRYAVAAALTLVLLWAAVSDVMARRIPNPAVLAVLTLFVPWSVSAAGAGLIAALGAGAIAFCVGYGLYMFNIVGAGDAKLFAAMALFAGMTHLGAFALATVLTGGLMAVISLATRPRRAAVMFMLRGKGDYGRGIPYGVAIGAGGALVLWMTLIPGAPLFR